MTEEIKGSFPDGVTLRRDATGVIHVSGPDESGLAWGMGYAHACDRGLQMLMTRILGWGKASEYLAANEETVGIDRFFRRMGWAQPLTCTRPRGGLRPVQLGALRHLPCRSSSTCTHRKLRRA